MLLPTSVVVSQYSITTGTKKRKKSVRGNNEVSLTVRRADKTSYDGRQIFWQMCVHRPSCVRQCTASCITIKILHHALHHDRAISAFFPAIQKSIDKLGALNLQLDALLMLKLPPRTIHSPKAKLVPIQFKLDMWAIQHRHAVPTGLGTVTSRHCKNEHRALFRQHYQIVRERATTKTKKN